MQGKFLEGINKYFQYVVVTDVVKNGTHQLLAYVDDVNVLGGKHTYFKGNREALLVATKETGLEVKADKTKYMFMSREQTAGLSHTMKVDNSSIERVEEFKYLGTMLTNQNLFRKKLRAD